ncbi:MAG: M48 family metalloprotease [Acidobacteriota bacterium]
MTGRIAFDRRFFPAALLAVGALTLTTGCATNPATGRSQLSLYSEAQEIEIGRSADQDIVNQYGLYDDDELAAYVDRLGQDLAAVSERPNLPWTFRVLDDPVVNAFALPGGYIYVTRGILSHFGSESELAAVLGHEIAHVTARHGVSRMSKAQLANIGLGVGSVLSPELARAAGGLAQGGLQLLFLKYSRDDERQADDLGYRYTNRVGQNPEGFVGVFEMLSAQGRLGGVSRLPGYLATHPEPEERLATARGWLAAAPQQDLERPLGRDVFLDHLEQMPFGADPNEGFFVGRRFIHPGLRFEMRLPDGWTGYNQEQALVVVNSQQDAIIQLTLTSENDVDAAARAFYGQQGISVRSSWSDSRGVPRVDAGRRFQAGSGDQQLYGMAGFVDYDQRIYRLLAVSKPGAWRQNERALEDALASFERLTDRQYLNVQGMRIELVRLDRDMSIEEFQRRYPSDIDLARLAVMNGVEAGGTLERGQRVKRVVGFNPGSQVGVELRGDY